MVGIGLLELKERFDFKLNLFIVFIIVNTDCLNKRLTVSFKGNRGYLITESNFKECQY